MKKITSRSMSDEIYDQLKDALMAGHFEPGQRLSIVGLAEEMGTSVTPVREAIFRLVSDGALAAPKAQSIIVRHPSPSELAELRRIRILLEGEAAFVAAQVATTTDLVEITRLNDAFFEALKTGDRHGVSESNRAFHLAVASIASMPILLSLIEIMWVRMGPIIHLWRNLKPEGASKYGPDHPHFSVIEGLRTRNSELARKSIQDDIQFSTINPPA